ncbi:hypothetical protein BH09PAT3_BH09PAT3_6060 [soil metagenome]
MAVTGLTSDDFKFHLRKLVKLGLVMKNSDGAYELTAKGKELANRYDYDNLTPIRQPKLTTATYLRRHNPKTKQMEYLFQQRLRQPFFNYWGVIGEPVRWGEDFNAAAARGLQEQTGLTDQLSLQGMYRQRDLANDSEEVLEDKLFLIFVAEWQGQEIKQWPYAKSRWMTASELSDQAQRFDSCVDMLAMIEANQFTLGDNTNTYPNEVY